MNKSIDTFNAACKSIRVDYSYDPSMSLEGNLEALGNAEGYEEARGNKTWVERVHVWARSKDSKFLTFNLRGEPVIVENQKEKQELAFDVEAGYEFGESPTILPFWDSQGNILIGALSGGLHVVADYIIKTNTVPKIKSIKETKPMKSLFDKMLQTNKESAVMAAQVTAGKAANDFIQAKLYASLPWYARFFAKKKDAKNNALAKLAVANAAVGLSQHFAENDPKLKYISEAMLQDAMISLSRDSDVVEKFIAELTDVVKVPNEILETFNKEQGMK